MNVLLIILNHYPHPRGEIDKLQYLHEDVLKAHNDRGDEYGPHWETLMPLKQILTKERGRRRLAVSCSNY